MTYSARYVPKGSKTPPPGMESNRTSVFICLELIGGSKTNFFGVTLLSVFDKCEISRALERVKQNYSFIEKKITRGRLGSTWTKRLVKINRNNVKGCEY